jgi:predicted nucleic acid-binding protein
LRLYLDSSALVKRYVAEEGSDEVRLAMGEAETWSSCRLAFVETVRAVGLKAGREAVRRVVRDWSGFHVVELDQRLAEHAARLAVAHGLRSLDAIHLGAALRPSPDGHVVATWDVRLHGAARALRLLTLPEALD